MWDRTIRTINRTVENITALMLLVMVILVFLQVVSRAIMQSSFAWTEEAARYLMIWLTFLGASYAFQYAAHISIELFVSKLKGPLATFFKVLAALCSIAFLFVLIVKGIEIIDRSMVQRSAALRIPLGYVYLIMPISGVLMLLNVIDVTIKQIKGSSGQANAEKGDV